MVCRTTGQHNRGNYDGEGFHYVVKVLIISIVTDKAHGGRIPEIEFVISEIG